MSFAQDFYRYLTARRSDEIPTESDRYDSYFGDCWSTPIHCGILSTLQPDPSCPQHYESFIRWHEQPGPFLKVGAMFGLNQDFDHFLVAYAGPLYALLCALMKDVAPAASYLASHLRSVWKVLRRGNRSSWSHLAVWYAHILSSTGSCSDFEVFRSEVNDLGGIAEEFLIEPIGGGELIGEQELQDGRCIEHAFKQGIIKLPTLDEFRSRFCIPHENEISRRREAVRLAMAVLVYPSDLVVESWAEKIVSVLHGPCSALTPNGIGGRKN